MTLPRSKIGEICRIEKGNIGIMKAVPGPYPLVVLAKERKSHIDFQFDDDAVVVPLVSSTGHGHRSMKRIFYQTGKFAVGSILCALIPVDKRKVSAEYLYRYLDLTKERELVSRMRGMANVTLPMSEIANVEVPLPDFATQKRLIESFKSLEVNRDKLRFEINYQLELVRKLRQAWLREAMQGKLVPRPANAEVGKILSERAKEEKSKLIDEKKIRKTNLLVEIKPEEISSSIPSHWIWVRLGDICEINPRNRADDALKAGFVPMPSVSQSYGETPKFEVRQWETIKSGFTHFADNDVIVAKITPCFENSKAGIVRDLPNGIGAGTTELYVIRGNGVITPEFIYAFIKTREFLENGEHVMRGVAGQQRVPSEYVYKTLVPLPSLTEQMLITEKLQKLMKYCDALEANIRTSKQHAETLLQVAVREALEPGLAKT
jgi:type I restriction enzyme, S subunit